MRLPFVLVWLVALTACEPEPAAPAAVEPVHFDGDLETVDDGAADPGFAAFRDTLRAIAARRDTTALLALVGDGARLSFGDDAGGPDGLRTMWLEGDPPGDRPLWDVLAHALNGGSVEEDGAYVAPSVAGLWPDDLDPYATIAVPGTDVPVYDAPGGDVVATVSTIALPRDAPPVDGWQTITLPDGRSAVIAADETYSPVGYRLSAWDDGDGWKLRTLLTGD